MRLRAPFRRLRKDESGATIVEFALVSVPFILLLLGIIDIGYHAYLSAMVQGTLNEAARQVTVGGVTGSTVDSFVTGRIKAVSPQGTVVITKKSYFDFTHVGKPEPITTDTAPLGVYNHGDCFEDDNGNGVWDADSGASGLGGAEDIVYYTATVSYTGLVPLQALLGFSSTETVTGTAMMKNQPYAAHPDPQVICN